MLNSAGVGWRWVAAATAARGSCVACRACSGVMVWWMGAVSGASGVDAVRAGWTVLVCAAGCSLVLGRRSVFIFLSASALKGLPGRREEDAALPDCPG